MWPWRKAPEPEPERVTPPAPAPPPAGWREVGPIQRAVATPSLISPATRMSATLSSWQNPTFLAPLGHVVSPDAPSGIVHDLPVPVQKAADGPELVVPTPKSTSSQRTVVSRALAMFSSSPGPTGPTLSASSLDEPVTFDPAPAVHAGDAPQGGHASHDHAPLPLASPPAPTVQRVVAADPPTARFTTASDAGLPVVTLQAIAEPSPAPTPSTPDIAEAPTLGSEPAPVQSAPEPPEPAAEPAAPPAAVQRAAEPSAPELPLASVQRSTPPPAGRRLGLGAPLIPSPGPAPSSATELPLQAPAAGVSGDALPATPPPAIVAAPDTPVPPAEPSPAVDVASLLGDAPLVQRSVADTDAPADLPADDGTGAGPAQEELPVGTAPTPPPPLGDTSSPAGSLPLQASPTVTSPTLGASSTPPVVLRSAADPSATPPAGTSTAGSTAAGSTAASSSSASASLGGTSPASAPVAGFSSAGTDPTGPPLASLQRTSTLPTSTASASAAPAPAAQASTLADLSVTGTSMAGAPATSTPTDTAVQRTTSLPVVPAGATDASPTTAPDHHEAPLVVAQLIGDRSLPLRAAPEPDAPTPAPAPASASVQRWADPYGSAQPASLPGTAPGGGATASAAGYPNVQRSTAPATIAPEMRGAGGGMASDWLAPPMTDVATLPAVPIQRATSPAPSAPHPSWSAGQPVGPVVAPTVQRARVSDAAPVRMEFVNPVVARVPEEVPADPPAPAPAAPVEPPPAAAPTEASAGPAPQGPAAPGAPAAAGTPEEMLAKIFDPLLRRLKTELRLDRERHGSLTDLRH